MSAGIFVYASGAVEFTDAAVPAMWVTRPDFFTGRHRYFRGGSVASRSDPKAEPLGEHVLVFTEISETEYQRSVVARPIVNPEFEKP